MIDTDLTRQEAHFAFGRNWAAYAEGIRRTDIDEAVLGLSRLLGNQRLDGKSFLDIGSGSGLHSLAALRLGAANVVAIDIDPDSVATTQAVLEHYAPRGNFRVERASVLELDPSSFGVFDTVYSWGVLHHTGDMDRAIRSAATLVCDGGLFVFALYRRIWMDWFWRREKRWYAKATPQVQARARAVHSALFRLGLRLTRRRFSDYVRHYHGNRGMDFFRDIHDWMGGWPYESISPREVERLMANLNFTAVHRFARSGRILGRDPGILGSGCDEYVYRKMSKADL